jgi:glutathione S-transferase
MTQFTLYNAPQSTCSQRVRFVLNSKKLQFEEKKLDLFSGDQLKPEYLKINPNGVVPALIHDDRIILDSSVIIEYLDDVFSEISLFSPKDPVARAKMRWMIRYIDEIPTPAIRFPSYNLAFLPHFKSMKEEEFIALANSKPLRKEFLLSMGRTGFSKADMDQAVDKLNRSVIRMNDWIEENGGIWLMGDKISLADIAIMPVIVRMDDINLDNAWKTLPNIKNWLENIKNQPAFKATYYPGSLLTEKYPHLAALRENKPV